MSVTWADIENALRTAVVNGTTEMDDEQIIWSDQGGPRPTTNFITLSLGPLTTVGQPTITNTFDEDAAAGEEMETAVTILQAFTLRIQAFDFESTGDPTARGSLSRLQASLALPSQRAALASVGISIFDYGSVQPNAVAANGRFEARAILDVRCYLNESVSERNTYIESVEVTDTSTDATFVVQLEEE